jgi:hypothetical protein
MLIIFPWKLIKSCEINNLSWKKNSFFKQGHNLTYTMNSLIYDLCEKNSTVLTLEKMSRNFDLQEAKKYNL